MEATDRDSPLAPAPTSGQATTIFVLSIIGLTVCGLLAPVAWFMGTSYRRQCLEAEVAEHQLGTIGRIIGMIGTVIFLLSTLLALSLTAIYVLILVFLVMGGP